MLKIRVQVSQKTSGKCNHQLKNSKLKSFGNFDKQTVLQRIPMLHWKRLYAMMDQMTSIRIVMVMASIMAMVRANKIMGVILSIRVVSSPKT